MKLPEILFRYAFSDIILEQENIFKAKSGYSVRWSFYHLIIFKEFILIHFVHGTTCLMHINLTSDINRMFNLWTAVTKRKLNN